MRRSRACLGVAVALAAAFAAAPRPAPAASLGSDPVAPAHLVEEPAEALCLWYAAGMRGMPLVHISARPGFVSGQLDAPADTAATRAALDAAGCDALRPRASSVLRSDALWDSDNFLVPAHRLGVVREVWWVLPARGTLADAPLPRFRDWLRQVSGLPAEFLDGLTLEGAVVRGEYQGLPVRIVTLADLPAIREPVLVGVDAEYLVRLYDSPVREGLLDLLAGFLATLRARGLAADGLVVSASCRDGRVPLELGYLAGQLRDTLAEPGRFAQGPPEAWRIQGRIEYLSYMGARDDAEQDARRLAAIDPGSPVPWYDQAQLAAGRGDVAAALQLLGEAVRREGRYRAGYAGLARILAEREQPAAARELLEAGHAAFPDDLPLGMALADFYEEQGPPGRAVEHLAALAGRLPAYPAAHAALAFALREAGRSGEAQAAMEDFRRTAPAGGMRREVLAAWERAPEEPPPAADTPPAGDVPPAGDAPPARQNP